MRRYAWNSLWDVFTWHDMCTGRVSGQRVHDVIAMIIHEQKSGIRFLRRRNNGGTFGKLKEAWRERYIQALGAASGIVHVSWGRLEVVWAGYARSDSKHSRTLLILSKCWRAVIKYVRVACKVTLYGWSLLALLLYASWRVWRTMWNYHRLLSKAIYFQAEINWYEVLYDFKLSYLQDFLATVS